ncbi:response regulator [Anabaena sp. UHCC 0253]|uniref:response regulator transcription factor n=1 Tax=Anabaena sp. UHCC 0253 TaxID=2590019 RepID=UPI001447FBEE|nr:response regulator [Anabaena sp. UHCC 0253]MTJ52577.1 response regulator [Anabaena sp. UHCC 0253]
MKNILVVESHQKFCYLLSQFLRNNNFHVIEARNFFIGSYLAKEQYPDLIICSLEIVEEIGYQTLQKIQDSSITTKVPLILLTNKPDVSSSLNQIHQLGADILLKKTVGFSRLLEVIKLQLNKDEGFYF